MAFLQFIQRTAVLVAALLVVTVDARYGVVERSSRQLLQNSCLANTPDNGASNGKATVYGGNGAGACGYSDGVAPFIVAISGQFFPSGICGQCIEITQDLGNGQVKRIEAVVTDECPECPPWHLDLGTSTWNALIGTSPGVAQGISWRTIACNNGPPKVMVKEGSNSFWAALQIWGLPYPAKAISLCDGSLGSYGGDSIIGYFQFNMNNVPTLNCVHVTLKDNSEWTLTGSFELNHGVKAEFPANAVQTKSCNGGPVQNPPQNNPSPPQNNPSPPQNNPSPPQNNPSPPQNNPSPPQNNPPQNSPPVGNNNSPQNPPQNNDSPKNPPVVVSPLLESPHNPQNPNNNNPGTDAGQKWNYEQCAAMGAGRDAVCKGCLDSVFGNGGNPYFCLQCKGDQACSSCVASASPDNNGMWRCTQNGGQGGNGGSNGGNNGGQPNKGSTPEQQWHYSQCSGMGGGAADVCSKCLDTMYGMAGSNPYWCLAAKGDQAVSTCVAGVATNNNGMWACTQCNGKAACFNCIAEHASSAGYNFWECTQK